MKGSLGLIGVFIISSIVSFDPLASSVLDATSTVKMSSFSAGSGFSFGVGEGVISGESITVSAGSSSLISSLIGSSTTGSTIGSVFTCSATFSSGSLFVTVKRILSVKNFTGFKSFLMMLMVSEVRYVRKAMAVMSNKAIRPGVPITFSMC